MTVLDHPNEYADTAHFLNYLSRVVYSTTAGPIATRIVSEARASDDSFPLLLSVLSTQVITDQVLTTPRNPTLSSLFKALVDDEANLALFIRDLAETDDIDFLLHEWEETLAFEHAEPSAVIDILGRIERHQS
ncbi:MAG: hypothetical protein IIC71_09230 [Acidobacteria bacterium]|nr:hypothetical protein [Acidobacteriota bacterium]